MDSLSAGTLSSFEKRRTYRPPVQRRSDRNDSGILSTHSGTLQKVEPFAPESVEPFPGITGYVRSESVDTFDRN
jgi:hypothetical protein